MKKLLAFLLAALLIASLCACVGGDGDEDDINKYKEEEIIIDHIENDKGETFYFDSVDSISVAITGYNGSDDPHELVIPETLNGKTVVSIAPKAFYYCSKINAITIPASVTTIGDYAFAGCALVKSITIPETVTSLGKFAFYGCSGATTLTFAGTPGITEIKENTFNGCEALTSVTIPKEVKTVDVGAFYGCKALATVVISEGVEVLGKQAFQDCTALASLTLPASLVTIGSFNFTGSEALYTEGVTAPSGSAAATYIESINLSAKPAEEATN